MYRTISLPVTRLASSKEKQDLQVLLRVPRHGHVTSRMRLPLLPPRGKPLISLANITAKTTSKPKSTCHGRLLAHPAKRHR